MKEELGIQAPTVFVVDDDSSMRKAIARLLHAAGLKALTYASAQQYIECHDANVAGCLVTDLSMPGLNGLELQKALAGLGSTMPLIFITGNAAVPDAVEAMKFGAFDFLTKPVDANILINAVSKAISLDASARVKHAEIAELRKRLATLTPRERQVLAHVVAGKLNKQTASELGTVEKTIKVHRARIMEKLHVRSVAQLVQISALAGIPSTSLPS